jgi:methylmalonyl-CoA mutase cobalamin-binding subunit
MVINAFLAVESARHQVLSAVDGAMICILQDPHSSSAFGRIELCHRTKNIEENILHNVFGFARVPNDFQSYAENKAMVAIEKDRQGVVVSCPQVSHQLVVTQTLQLCKARGLRATFYGKSGVHVENSKVAH